MKKLALLFLIFALAPAAHAATIGKVNANNIGLVGYWTLDGSKTDWTTGKALDSAGGNTGQLINMSTTTSPALGRVGQAFNFNGNNDYISIADASPLNLATSFTVAAWTKRDSGATADDHIYTSGTQSNFWSVYRSATNFGLVERSIAAYTNSGTLANDVWYHTVVVKDGDGANNIKFYINGVADGVASAGTVSTPSGEKRIGCWTESVAADVCFDGSIDEVRIYNRALTATEVNALYNSGSAKVATSNFGSTTAPLSNGLVAYWTLDGSKTNWATGKTLDSAGSNTGQLVGMSTTSSPSIGRVGQAFNFDGIDDFITIQDSDSLTPPLISFAGWYKTRTPNDLQSYYLHSGGSNNRVDIFVGPFIFCTFGTGATFNGGSYAVPAASLDSSWHHVGCTWDGQNVRTYFDGVLVLTDPLVGTLPNINFSAQIGQRGGGSWFNGSIDDLRIYNRPLSAQEIQNLYQAGAVKVGQSNNTLAGNGLVGYWSMDGSKTNWTTGKTLDSSGQGNTGQLIGMSTTSSPAFGKIGQALMFNGESSEVDVSNSSSIQASTNNAITIASWVNLNSFFVGSCNFNMIYVKGTDINANDGTIQFAVANVNECASPGATNFAYFSVNIGGTRKNIKGSTNIPPNTWHHLVAVYNGSDIRIYLDGVSDATPVAAAGTIGTNNEPITIGRLNFPGFPFWVNGRIDDLRVYNKALTLQDIQQLFNAGR